MQAVESRGTTVIRYIFWLLFAAITAFLKEDALSGAGLNVIMASVFVIVGLLTSWIMFRRFRKEKIILETPKKNFRKTIANNFGFVMITIILIAAIRLLTNYLQYKNIIPAFQNDYVTSEDQKVLIFNLLANIFIISFQQFMVGIGFLFNYFWRKNSGINYLFGGLMSGIALAIISLSTNYQQIILFIILGFMYAITYRKTKDTKLTMIVIIFSNIIGSILI